MKSLTRLIFWASIVAIFFFYVCLPVLLAQTNAPAFADPEIPTTNAELWTLAISAVSPLIVWAISRLNIPVNLLPVLSPVVGVALGLLLNWMGGLHLSWFDMAKAGALAVFVREVVNQQVTKRLQAPPPEPVNLNPPNA